MKKVGISLGGGGAKGIAHLAFLDKLDKNNIPVSIVSGTSIGALIGAMYCGGLKAHEIFDKLRELDEKTSSGKKRRLFLRYSLQKEEKKTLLLKKALQYMFPVKTFEQLKIPLKVCAVDMYTLEEKMFDRGNLVDAVLASMALPGVISPFKINDRYYIDGGCVNVLPVDYIKSYCDVIIGIDVSSLNKPYHLIEPTAKNAKEAFDDASRKVCFDKKIKETKVDLLYRIIFDKISTLDFVKYREAYNVGVKYSSDLIERLEKLL